MQTQSFWIEHMRFRYKENWALSFAYSPYDEYLAISTKLERDKQVIYLYDLASKQEIYCIEQPYSHHLVFSRDGRILAATNDEYGVQLINVADGKKIGMLAKGNRIGGMDFFSDRNEMAVVEYIGGTGILSIWNVALQQREKYIELLTNVRNVIVSPHGNYIAILEGETTVSLWDSRTLKKVLILKGHTKLIQSIEFTPQEFVITGSSDGTVRLWTSIWPAGSNKVKEIFSDKEVHEYEYLSHTSNKATINSASFSSQRLLLATAGVDGRVHLLNFRTWKEVFSLPLNDRIWHVKFSPYGGYLTALDETHTLVVWKFLQ